MALGAAFHLPISQGRSVILLPEINFLVTSCPVALSNLSLERRRKVCRFFFFFLNFKWASLFTVLTKWAYKELERVNPPFCRSIPDEQTLLRIFHWHPLQVNSHFRPISYFNSFAVLHLVCVSYEVSLYSPKNPIRKLDCQGIQYRFSRHNPLSVMGALHSDKQAAQKQRQLPLRILRCGHPCIQNLVVSKL